MGSEYQVMCTEYIIIELDIEMNDYFYGYLELSSQLYRKEQNILDVQLPVPGVYTTKRTDLL